MLKVLMLHEDTREPGEGGGAESLLRDETLALRRLGHQVVWWQGKGNLISALNAFQPDICHVGTVHNLMGVAPVEVLQHFRLPHIWAIMDYYPFCGGRMLLRHDNQSCSAVQGVCNKDCEQPYVDPIILEIANKSFVVGLNNYTATIYRRNGLRCDAVVELGIDTEMFAPDASKKDNYVSVYTSSAWPEYPQKGLPVLREAIEDTDIKVWVLAHMTRQKVADGLKRAHIYVFPSVYEETWGLSLCEAMASGCACIATDVAGAKAQIEDGITGLIVPKRDPAALREAIERLLADEPLRLRLGQAAREHVLVDHTLEAMGRRWEKVYEQVLTRERVLEVA